MPLGDHEVVHHAERPRVDHRRLDQRAVGSDLVQHQPLGGEVRGTERPQGPVRFHLGVGGERDPLETLAPGLELPPGKGFAVEDARGPGLPERQQLAVVLQDGGVGGVEVVRPAHRSRVLDDGPEPGIHPATGRTLAGELGRFQHPPPVGHGGAVEAERVDHAVPVEPMAVAKAEAFVHRRPVAIERPVQVRRQPSLDAGRAGEPVGGDTLPAEERRVRSESCGKLGGPFVDALRSGNRTGERRGQVREPGGPGGKARSEQPPAAPGVRRLHRQHLPAGRVNT